MVDNIQFLNVFSSHLITCKQIEIVNYKLERIDDAEEEVEDEIQDDVDDDEMTTPTTMVSVACQWHL